MDFARLPRKAQTFILARSWEDYFDSFNLKRGHYLFTDNDASIGEIVVDHDNSVFAFLTVTGSYAYEVEITLTAKNRLITTCDCADDPKCKHIAAALYTLQRHVLENQTEAEAKANVAPSYSVEDWLDSLVESTNEETPSPASEEFQPSYKERVIYMLGREYEYELVGLHAYKGRLQKDGSFKITGHNVRTDYQEYNKPKYITNTDLRILTQISRASGSMYESSSVSVDSAHFAELVLQCLATGRLINKTDESVHNRNMCYRPLKEGAKRKLTPSWNNTDSGALKPSVSITPKPDEIIESSPKIYIDRSENSVGVLEQDHTDQFLEQWLLGPTIERSEVSKVQSLISKTGQLTTAPNDYLSTSSPIPQLPEQRDLTGLSPVPVLSIQRIDATSSSSLLIDSPVANVLLATMSFEYGDFSVAAEPFKESFTARSNNLITTIHRDKKLESKLLKKLEPSKLSTLGSHFDTSIIQKEHAHSLLFSTNDVINTPQWIAFISNTVPDLEAAGWDVEIGDLDYTLIEYDELYEDLNHDDHSSQWFRFDLGVEHNGEKISLIPALAAAIASGMYKGYDFDSAGDGLIAIPLEKKNTFINFSAQRFKLILEKLQDLFQHINQDGVITLPQLRAATLIDDLDLAKSNNTLRDLSALGAQLKDIKGLPKTRVPKNLNAELRDYQLEGFRWLQFLAKHKLHGVLADDMGLGKTIQTLTHILAEKNSKRNKKLPTLVVAPTSVIPNWRAEAAKFTPSLSVLLLHGAERKSLFTEIPKNDIIITSYALLQRDEGVHTKQHYHIVILDESQYIKNAATKTTKVANKLKANHRLCLSGTPMENHLGELWSTFNFLMPGLLQSNKEFTATFRSPIERNSDSAKQVSLNRRVGPLLLRRTKDVVAKELPPKTVIPHHISLNQEQVDLYESVRASMDKRIRDAVKDQGLAKSQIIILDALLKLRQICCHPQLLKLEQAQAIHSSAKLDYLTQLLATLIEEGRRILIFSQFTTMLGKIESHLKKDKVPFVKITGATRDRETPVEKFQSGEVPVFLISLKAGGTGHNLTAADTVIHYDPWWNPAAENQATDRAYRIGQDKPVFVHKLICQGTIEAHIQKLQEKKSQLVESLLSGSTNKLSITSETIAGLLSPIED